MKSMMTTWVVATILIVALWCVGCGGPRLAHPLQTPEISSAEVDGLVRELVTALQVKAFPKDRKYKIAVLDAFGESKGTTNFDQYLTMSVIRQLQGLTPSSGAQVVILDQEDIRDQMASLGLEANADNVKLHAAEWNIIGLRTVLLTRWRLTSSDKVEVTIEAFDVASDGTRVYTGTQAVEKDNFITRKLGEHLPGTLVINVSHGDALAYIDNRPQGKMSGNKLVLELPYGSHSIRLTKSGFGPFSKSVFIREQTTKTITVEFQSPTSAPVGALLLSAAVPGTAAAAYKKNVPKGILAANGIFALSFYSFLGMFIADNSLSDDELLTSKQVDKVKTVKNVELYTALGCYALNVITGLVIGNKYRVNNKRAVEVDHVSSKPPPYLGLRLNSDKTPMFCLNVAL